MEGKHYSVCPTLQRKNPPGVYDGMLTRDVKAGFDATPECLANNGLFIPSTSEVFTHDDKSYIQYKSNFEGVSIDKLGSDIKNKSSLNLPSNEISTVLKALPNELMESLKRTFKSDNLDTSFKPIQHKQQRITHAPGNLDWSIYNQRARSTNESIPSPKTDIYQTQHSNYIDMDIEQTNMLDGPAIFARKYFTHFGGRQESIQSDTNDEIKSVPKETNRARWVVQAAPFTPQITKPRDTNCEMNIQLEKSSSKVLHEPITILNLDSMQSSRVSDEVVIEQHTLREGDEMRWEEQAHLDWLVTLKEAFLVLRKDPSATRQQLRIIKHRLAKGLGKERWKRDDYYPKAHLLDEFCDSDDSDGTYSSITVTSYASVVDDHDISPSRFILDEPCNIYNFFGDDQPLFESVTHKDNSIGGVGDASDTNETNDYNNEYKDDKFRFIAGNNFMHIKSYGWFEILPQPKSSFSHIPPYCLIYYEMRNDFLVLYYDNSFGVKSRLHVPCKVKKAGWITRKFNKKFISKKINCLKQNEALYDHVLKLFHFGDAGRGEDIKHLLLRENFTPICAIHLKGNYTLELDNSEGVQKINIKAQSIPLNNILWTRVKGPDDDFFPAANFESLSGTEKLFTHKKFGKNCSKETIENLRSTITKSLPIEMSILTISHMENEDLVSKAVSRKRAFKIIHHLNSIKIPTFQHLSHFYNCPYLRELSLANIKFNEVFDRFIFITSVKSRPLKILDYRFRQITDEDLDIIIDYLSCKVEWFDLSNNNIKNGDKLSELVKKGKIQRLTLGGNPLDSEIISKFKRSVHENSNDKSQSESIDDEDYYSSQMRNRFLDTLSFEDICIKEKIYSGRLASFQWGLVFMNKTKQLVLRGDFDKRIPENLLPLHYIYFELRGSYLVWFPHPLNKNSKTKKRKSAFQAEYSYNIKIKFQNVFFILDCNVVKRAGFKWLKIKATKIRECLTEDKTNEPFYLYLRGPSDSVTHTWMTFIAKLIAGQLYLNTCDQLDAKPSRAILDYCWQPWSQHLILHGYPLDYDSLTKFMTRLRKSLRLKYLNASNMKIDGITEFRPFEQTKLLRLDLSLNKISMENESERDNVIDFCTKNIAVKEFIMDGNPLGNNVGTAKLLHKSITSLTANVIKFNYVELGDIAGTELCNLFASAYNSVGYVKVIELRGHKMSKPVLEQVTSILKERCPNLEQITLTSSIDRHIEFTNDVLEIRDIEVEKCNLESVKLHIVGHYLHHKHVRKGKNTTRFAKS